MLTSSAICWPDKGVRKVSHCPISPLLRDNAMSWHIVLWLIYIIRIIITLYINICLWVIRLRFGSSYCSVGTSYTSFKSSWPADFDYLGFGSIPWRCVIFFLHSVKRTVEIGAVALWYLFMLAKLSRRVNIAKTLFWSYLDENPHILPCFVTFWRHNVIEIFQLLMYFGQIISPVNRDFVLDRVNFYHGTFGSKCSGMSVPNLMGACWKYIALWHCVVTPFPNCGPTK